MLLDTILAPKSADDFFQARRLQVVAVSEARLGLGATVEDVVYNLIPGVASRSVLLPLVEKHRGWHGRALDDVAARIREAGGKVRRAHPDRAALDYEYERDAAQGPVRDTLHVRLLHTDVSFMQIAGEAGEHADDPPVNFAEVRAQVVEIIRADAELPESARKRLLTHARNPAYPVSTLTTEYARAKKDRALTLLAEAHGRTCARAAYMAQRELTRSPATGRLVAYDWDILTEAERAAVVAVTVKVIRGQTAPFQHGAAYGPFFLGVVQACLMHIVGAGEAHARERAHVAELVGAAEPAGSA